MLKSPMSIVYFIPVNKAISLSESAGKLLKQAVDGEQFELQKNLPIKIHPGAIGNTSYIKPENYEGIISFLKSKKIKPYYVETCMSWQNSLSKENEFNSHGFKDLPIVIADGLNGDEDLEIKIPNGKNIKYSLIAKKLNEVGQVLVVSHFKGHSMAGFGGALKNLGIGFASGRGKLFLHGLKDHYDVGDTLDWDKSHLPGISKKWVENWNSEVVSSDIAFRERIAESAFAAVSGKRHLYLTFATNIVNNCDCDGKSMDPVYQDLGVFASTDPVAIDKAVFDLLEKREGEAPFEGLDIFPYSESLGLGSSVYKLITLK